MDLNSLGTVSVEKRVEQYFPTSNENLSSVPNAKDYIARFSEFYYHFHPGKINRATVSEKFKRRGRSPEDTDHSIHREREERRERD